MIFSVEKKQSSIKRNRKKLRKEMIKKENFHINDLIDYEKFLKLYQLYGHKLSESEFASSFLDLSINDLYNLKKNRCKVLKKEEIDDSEIISLKLKMIKELNLKSGQSLSYEEIEELYNNTETILPLILFAEKILDVSSHSLSTIKNNSSKKATIFNNTEKEYFSEEPLEQLIQKIKKLQIEKTKKNQNLKELFNIPLYENKQNNQRQNISNINLRPLRKLNSLSFIGLFHKVIPSPSISGYTE